MILIAKIEFDNNKLLHAHCRVTGRSLGLELRSPSFFLDSDTLFLVDQLATSNTKRPLKHRSSRSDDKAG